MFERWHTLPSGGTRMGLLEGESREERPLVWPTKQFGVGTRARTEVTGQPLEALWAKASLTITVVGLTTTYGRTSYQ
jgi:hypothetical protein